MSSFKVFFFFFYSEHHNEKFTAYSSGGIIVANIDEILHNFSQIVGCHDIKAKQPIIDDMLSPKGAKGLKCLLYHLSFFSVSPTLLLY